MPKTPYAKQLFSAKPNRFFSGPTIVWDYFATHNALLVRTLETYPGCGAYDGNTCKRTVCVYTDPWRCVLTVQRRAHRSHASALPNGHTGERPRDCPCTHTQRCLPKTIHMVASAWWPWSTRTCCHSEERLGGETTRKDRAKRKKTCKD